MPDGSIRDRVAMLSRGELIGLVVIVAVALGGAALWYVRSLPRAVEVRHASAPVAPSPGGILTSPSGAAFSSSPQGSRLIVDVAGAVRKPGVYEFDQGDRVIDAIRAAGGATGRASLDALNLAAPLTDGTQVLVPRDVVTQPASSGTEAPGTPTALINVNTASAAELEALPGIGEVLAQRIVDYRTQNGPFASVDALLDVSGIGDAILAEIHDLVTV